MYELISRTAEGYDAIIIRHAITGEEIVIAEGLTDEESNGILEGAMLTLGAIEKLNKTYYT